MMCVSVEISSYILELLFDLRSRSFSTVFYLFVLHRHSVNYAWSL